MAMKRITLKNLAVGIAALIVIGVALYVVLKFDFLQRVENGGVPLLPLVLVSALSDSINPCAFSVFLLTIGFLFSLGQLRKQVLAVGASYISGIFIMYVLIGLGILRALSFFKIPGFMGKVGATILVVFGFIDIINVYYPQFPIKLKIPAGSHKILAVLMEKGSVPAAFLLGAVVGLFEFPCTGGPYLMILGLLHDTRTFVNGFGYLLFYNLLFVVPLIVMLVVASNPLLFEKVQAWKRDGAGNMRSASGVIMVLLGILIFLL